MAQLLGLRLAQAAYDRGEAAIREEDFDAALARLIEDAPPRARALYASLTAHGHDVEMAAALHWLATARQDRWGRLQAGFTPRGAVVVDGRAVSAGCWERLQAAGAVQTCGVGSGLASFADRALLHHVLLLSARHTPLGEPLGGHSAPNAAPDAGAGAGASVGTSVGASAGRVHSLVHGG